jgi:hypothetical protein
VLGSSIDHPYFIPAETLAEAISRIYGLTGARSRGRGEKRALVALRDALGVDVDIVRTNDVMAERIATELGVEWQPQFYTIRNKVNLAGLNALLEGATDAFQRGALLRQSAQDVPKTLSGSGLANFNPALSKIEAVTRISRLTGAPDEWLGPGSKEHKSVLENLAKALLPDAALDHSSKTRLGRSIASELDVQWTDLCYSTGETISLDGLNAILAGAERRLGRLGATAAEMLASPEAEGAALVAALHDGWRAEPWDGRAAVEWMRAQGVRGSNENEWQGWYFEARGREVLNAAFPPNRTPVRATYGKTVFDYSLNFVWDLKAHTEEQVMPVSRRTVTGDPTMILNDEMAIRECIAEQGIGFLVLGGRAVMDESLEFITWHRAFKARQGIRSAPSNSGRSRMRKAAFSPLRVEAFWISSPPELDAAVAAGHVGVRTQGRQAPRSAGEVGAPRRDKFQMNVVKAREGLLVASREWQSRPTRP